MKKTLFLFIFLCSTQVFSTLDIRDLHGTHTCYQNNFQEYSLCYAYMAKFVYINKLTESEDATDHVATLANTLKQMAESRPSLGRHINRLSFKQIGAIVNLLAINHGDISLIDLTELMVPTHLIQKIIRAIDTQKARKAYPSHCIAQILLGHFLDIGTTRSEVKLFLSFMPNLIDQTKLMNASNKRFSHEKITHLILEIYEKSSLILQNPEYTLALPYKGLLSYQHNDYSTPEDSEESESETELTNSAEEEEDDYVHQQKMLERVSSQEMKNDKRKEEAQEDISLAIDIKPFLSQAELKTRLSNPNFMLQYLYLLDHDINIATCDHPLTDIYEILSSNMCLIPLVLNSKQGFQKFLAPLLKIMIEKKTTEFEKCATKKLDLLTSKSTELSLFLMLADLEKQFPNSVISKYNAYHLVKGLCVALVGKADRNRRSKNPALAVEIETRQPTEIMMELQLYNLIEALGTQGALHEGTFHDKLRDPETFKKMYKNIPSFKAIYFRSTYWLSALCAFSTGGSCEIASDPELRENQYKAYLKYFMRKVAHNYRRVHKPYRLLATREFLEAVEYLSKANDPQFTDPELRTLQTEIAAKLKCWSIDK